MSPSGFFLELLIPGATATSAFLLLLLEVRPISVQAMERQGWLLLTLFLMCSYVVGIILRHAPGFPKPKHYYRLRIEKEWPEVAKALASCLTQRLQAVDRGDESGLRCPEEPAKFSDNESAALITYLREYVLAEKSAGISEFFNYEWRLSRLARNCAPSMAVLSLASWTAFAIEISRNAVYAYLYALGGLSAILGIAGLWYAYRRRIFWQVDILMRVGSLSFCLRDRETTLSATGASS